MSAAAPKLEARATTSRSDEGAGHAMSFEGRTIDEARAIGSAVFHPHSVRPLDRGGPFRLGIDAFRLGAITVGTIEYNRSAHIETGPYNDSYQVNIPLEGTLRTSAGARTVVAMPRRGAVYGRDVPTSLEGWDSGCRVLAIKIDRAALESRLAAMTDQAVTGAIDFELALDLDTAWGREWRWFVRLFSEQLHDDGALLRYPVLASAVADGMMTGLLLAARHQYSDLLGGRHVPAAPVSVRRIEELMRFAPHLPLTAIDLAQLAGTTPRALQLGFQRHYGMPPHAYLRQIRLERVHQELSADAATTPVISDTAKRWGFGHVGRFATDYFRIYGELPSATVARARQPKSEGALTHVRAAPTIVQRD